MEPPQKFDITDTAVNDGAWDSVSYVKTSSSISLPFASRSTGVLVMKVTIGSSAVICSVLFFLSLDANTVLSKGLVCFAESVEGCIFFFIWRPLSTLLHCVFFCPFVFLCGPSAWHCLRDLFRVHPGDEESSLSVASWCPLGMKAAWLSWLCWLNCDNRLHMTEFGICSVPREASPARNELSASNFCLEMSPSSPGMTIFESSPIMFSSSGGHGANGAPMSPSKSVWRQSKIVMLDLQTASVRTLLILWKYAPWGPCIPCIPWEICLSWLTHKAMGPNTFLVWQYLIANHKPQRYKSGTRRTLHIGY